MHQGSQSNFLEIRMLVVIIAVRSHICKARAMVLKVLNRTAHILDTTQWELEKGFEYHRNDLPVWELALWMVQKLRIKNAVMHLVKAPTQAQVVAKAKQVTFSSKISWCPRLPSSRKKIQVRWGTMNILAVFSIMQKFTIADVTVTVMSQLLEDSVTPFLLSNTHCYTALWYSIVASYVHKQPSQQAFSRVELNPRPRCTVNWWICLHAKLSLHCYVLCCLV